MNSDEQKEMADLRVEVQAYKMKMELIKEMEQVEEEDFLKTQIVM